MNDKRLISKAIACMDACYTTAPDDFLDQSDIVDESERLIDKFKKKWGITGEIGNSYLWESGGDKYIKLRANHDTLQRQLFDIGWSHMKELMINCGAGDVANEVLLEDLFGVLPPARAS